MSETKNNPKRALTTSKFAKPPEGAHEPKGVPPSAVAVARNVASKGVKAVFVVATPGGRGHHSIVVFAGDQLATHGGCVQPERAAKYAALHSAIYGLPVNATQATDAVRSALAREQPQATVQPATQAAKQAQAKQA